jgi:hypothetical protein
MYAALISDFQVVQKVGENMPGKGSSMKRHRAITAFLKAAVVNLEKRKTSIRQS